MLALLRQSRTTGRRWIAGVASPGVSAASPTSPKKMFALFYNYDAKNADDLAVKRLPLRGAHLKHANAARDSGLLFLGGAFSDSPTGGLLIFDGASRAQVEAFAASDPYVQGRLVSSFSVREWVVVVERDSPSH